MTKLEQQALELRLAYERIDELERRLARQHAQLINYKPKPPAGPNWYRVCMPGWYVDYWGN